MSSLSDALVAYTICAKAERKSPKTISWARDAVRYFSDFLGADHRALNEITAQDLRQFILALQSNKAYSRHRFTKPQDRPLSAQSIVSYVSAIKSFFSFLEREEIIPQNPMAKVKPPKVVKRVIATFFFALKPIAKTTESASIIINILDLIMKPTFQFIKHSMAKLPNYVWRIT